MKFFFFFSIFSCFSVFLFAQDIIKTQANDTIRAKILTEYEAVIKYALYNDPDGPTYMILKSKINSITYENGEVEYFDTPSIATPANSKIIAAENNSVVLSEKNRENVIRFSPVPMLLGAYSGYLIIPLSYSRYVTPKVAIPVMLQYIRISGLSEFTIMTGIEAVPATHRQKSGLYLNALAGISIYETIALFVATANMGYQIMTKSGFVFTAALGPQYDSFNNKVRFHFMLDFGFAF